MSIIIKSPQEIEKMRVAGRLAADGIGARTSTKEQCDQVIDIGAGEYRVGQIH